MVVGTRYGSTFSSSMGERSIRATSTATLPWPTMRAVSPDRSGENWERGERKRGKWWREGAREEERREGGGERERGGEKKGRRERGREGEKWDHYQERYVLL